METIPRVARWVRQGGDGKGKKINSEEQLQANHSEALKGDGGLAENLRTERSELEGRKGGSDPTAKQGQDWGGPR